MIRIAIPLLGSYLSPHFGRCDGFRLCDIEEESAQRPRDLQRPKQKCESLPLWLKSLGVNVVLTRGVGAVAVRGLEEAGLLVLAGGHGETPDALVAEYLAGWRGERRNTCHPHQPRHCRSKS